MPDVKHAMLSTQPPPQPPPSTPPLPPLPLSLPLALPTLHPHPITTSLPLVTNYITIYALLRQFAQVLLPQSILAYRVSCKCETNLYIVGEDTFLAKTGHLYIYLGHFSNIIPPFQLLMMDHPLHFTYVVMRIALLNNFQMETTTFLKKIQKNVDINVSNDIKKKASISLLISQSIFKVLS